MFCTDLCQVCLHESRFQNDASTIEISWTYLSESRQFAKNFIASPVVVSSELASKPLAADSSNRAVSTDSAATASRQQYPKARLEQRLRRDGARCHQCHEAVGMMAS